MNIPWNCHVDKRRVSLDLDEKGGKMQKKTCAVFLILTGLFSYSNLAKSQASRFFATLG